LGDQYASLGFETFAKTGDIYCLFYEKGFRLLHDNGILAFITSNKWMRAGYGEKLRAFFAKKTNPLSLIDFASQKIFESATVDVNILIFAKEPNAAHTIACIAKENCTGNLSVYVRREAVIASFVSSDSWTIMSAIESSVKRKMDEQGVPLREWKVRINRGILTGLNDAFIISGAVKDQLISEDPRSAEIIRPILRGRDVKRYHFDFSDLWLIVSHNGLKERGVEPIHIEDYPAVRAHLDQFGEKLAKRADKGDTPYNLRNCAYMDDFSKRRIVYREISEAMDACLVDPEVYINNKCYMIAGDHLIYILSFINSQLFTKIVLQQANVTGGKGEGFLSAISLIEPSEAIERRIEELYHMRSEGQPQDSIDAEVEGIFCDLYGLTAEERQYIYGQ